MTFFQRSDIALDFSSGFALETRVEIVAGDCNAASGTQYPRYGFHIIAVDDAGRLLSIGLCHNRVLLANNHLTNPGPHVKSVAYPVVGGPHELRLESTPGAGAQLWIDNTPILSVPIGAPYLPADAPRLWFGDGTAWASGDAYVEYIRFTASVLTKYCTAGTSSNGCTPTISGLGAPSASASTGFTLAVTGLDGQRSGLIFYGVSGRNAAPWSGGSSLLCVKPPLQRMIALDSNGTAGACDGAFAVDWNAFVTAHPTALGVPFQIGQIAEAQAWYRDPPAPGTTNFSDAIEFSVCP